MNRRICQTVAFAILLMGGLPLQATSLDQIGVTLLRAMTTNVDGSGIRVAQPEAQEFGTTNWEVNPMNATVLLPTNRFTFTSDLGTATNFPNALCGASGHATSVAEHFYGLTNGVATNVVHVDNYDAWFFITNFLYNLAPIPPAEIVNQSFTWGAVSISDQQILDSDYDNYEEAYGTLFISAACNASINLQVSPPGTAYNSISVGAFGGNSSIGPTPDNGRSKPDLTAPADETSYSTPQVAGAAALLLQAALRGDGGNTNDASDLRVIKALLLNGAVKPADWTNANSSPLDARYGAGVLNVFNSYEQLASGEQIFCASNLISVSAAHPPVGVTNTISVTSGWDAEFIFSGATNDTVNHYFFNVSNGMATATLVWNRQFGATNINDLDLFLFNTAHSNLVACSTSRVDNVEHIFATHLAAGRYDLQVVKNGGTNVVSDAEIYALAWAFVSPALQIARAGTNAAVSWPAYPAGFRVESATNLGAPVWSTNALPPDEFTNSRNSLTLNATNALRFFRLRQPNF